MKTESMSMPCSLTDRLDARFAALAAIGAVAAVGGLDQKAEAAIVSSGPVNIAIPVTTDGVYMNIVTGVHNSNAGLVPGWDVNPWGSGSDGLSLFNASAPSGGVYAHTDPNTYNLMVGMLVDVTSIYAQGTGVGTGVYGPANLNSDINYVGFRFQNEAMGNQIQYGWMQIHLGASVTDPARSIIAYAYENTGAGINVGATTPAPTSGMAILALGAEDFSVAAERNERSSLISSSMPGVVPPRRALSA